MCFENKMHAPTPSRARQRQVYQNRKAHCGSSFAKHSPLQMLAQFEEEPFDTTPDRYLQCEHFFCGEIRGHETCPRNSHKLQCRNQHGFGDEKETAPSSPLLPQITAALG